MLPGLKVKLLDHYRDLFRVVALVDGREIGHVTIVKRPGPVWSVSNSSVQPRFHRQGVATAMYELAAKTSCRLYRSPLASDVSRTPEIDAFWKKQVAKGRGRIIPAVNDYGTHLDRIVLSCPAPRSLAGHRR